MTEYLPKAVRSTVAVGGRFSGLSKTLLRAAAIATVLVVLAPVMVILLSWGSDQGEIWQHLIDTQLATLLRNTLVLVAGVIDREPTGRPCPDRCTAPERGTRR